MRDLKMKKESNSEEDYTNALDNLRAQINVADNQLIDIVGKRKNEVFGNIILEGEKVVLSEEIVIKMFKAIHQESIIIKKK